MTDHSDHGLAYVDIPELLERIDQKDAEIARLKELFEAETLRSSTLAIVAAAARERLVLADGHAIIRMGSRHHCCSLCYLATMAHEALADTIYADSSTHHGLIEAWERSRSASAVES